MKRLQEETMCKMAVLGRGSMKDRQKVYNKSNFFLCAHISYQPFPFFITHSTRFEILLLHVSFTIYMNKFMKMYLIFTICYSYL